MTQATRISLVCAAVLMLLATVRSFAHELPTSLERTPPILVDNG